MSTTRRFLRLHEVLEIIPVSKSTWWAGVKSGRFPKGIKLGTRIVAWREEDITALINTLSTAQGPTQEVDHED
ncbi:hypothetical protein JCM16814_04740 [Desulfobaculum senezii]